MEENVMDMDKYVDPFIMKVLICDEIKNNGMDFSDILKIKEFIKNVKVDTKEDEIREFLDNYLNEKYSDLAMRVKKDCYSDPSVRFADRLIASKYKFDKDTFEYFNIYVDILKEKSLKLLDVVDIICNIKKKDLDNDKDVSVLSDLDISIEDGNILCSDMLRIVKPTVENIIDLKKYTDMANDLYTYLNFNVNKDLLYLNGVNYYDLFPLRDLQVNDIELDSSTRGYVSLTLNQKKKRYELNQNNYRLVLSMIDDLK